LSSAMLSAYSCLSDEHPGTTNHQNSAYSLEWLLPKLSFPDRIVVKDVRTWCVDHCFWTTL